jgi:hypothetical protein
MLKHSTNVSHNQGNEVVTTLSRLHMPCKCANKERIEKFASWVPAAYICTYHHLEQQQQQAGAAPVIEDPIGLLSQ